MYRDITGKRARGVGAQAGLIGALIGGAVGASSEGPGKQRFDQAVSSQPVDIKELVRRQVTTALHSSSFFQLVPANGDATFNLEVIEYGVAPVNDRNLGAAIEARATLVGRDGKEIWSKVEWGASNTSAPLEEFEHNPRLWPRTAAEASEELARKLILVMSASERTVPPTAL